MNIHRRNFPVTKTFINTLRKEIRKNYSINFEKNLTDREVLRISETVLLNARLKEIFKEGENLSEEGNIEY